jgi:tetratricopeptide (TPR) repeat protein
MPEPARADVRYTAFLSYSHQDAAAAGRLHRRLETYRIPRRLVGTASPRGPVSRRLWPIFRDREELPAATDLSETVHAALAQSGALIILCSPHAAASLWVAEEIETFRRLHPDRPILAAILEGDPPDCFPKALRAYGQDGTWHEPLATDLRPGRDGRHLGLLKLVAGIAGIGLDDLVQRDASRRVRRITAVTGAAIIAALIMATLAVVALQARREADRQRAEAEGLIEFMLTDVRNKLRSVGRLDVMKEVNVRALGYYLRDSSVTDRSAASLLQRARILHAIGEDEVSFAHLDRALTTFLEAHRITSAQMARTPSDPQTLLDHGRSEYWIGRVAEIRQDWQIARHQYDLFAETIRRLIAIAPNNPTYMMELAWSEVDRGNVLLYGTPRDAAGAQTAYRTAVEWFRLAWRARPSDTDAPRVLANAYGWLADSFFVRDRWGESLEARERQYRLVERLFRSDPDNADNIFRFALARRAIAQSLVRTGQVDRARRELSAAFAFANQLSARDPSNAEWRVFGAIVRCDLLSREFRGSTDESPTRLSEEIARVVVSLGEGNPRLRPIYCAGPSVRSRARTTSGAQT